MKAIRTQPGWGAKCGCGTWLTKWDFTPEDALAAAASAPCPKCGVAIPVFVHGADPKPEPQP